MILPGRCGSGDGLTAPSTPSGGLATYVVGQVHRPAGEPALGPQPQVEADPSG